jgi:phospholipid/cholesterol/gamma-HCH transport system substrate-binding protein
VRGLLAPLIKLIVFIVITAFATYILGATIANASYGSTNTYHAIFTDVSGLQVSDDVRVAGVRVGSITSIKVYRPHGYGEEQTSNAEISFTMAKSRPLPVSTEAILRYRNLVGQRYLDIEQGAGDPNDLLKPGGTIPVGQTQNSLDLTVLFQGFQPLFEGLSADQINDLSSDIVGTLQGEGGSLELLLSNLGDLTNTLADKDQVIGDVVDNLANVLTEVGDRDSELSDLVVQLQGFISGLSQDRFTIGNAIDGINGLASSTANLLTQARQPLAQDISDLSALTHNLTLPQSEQAITYVLQNLPDTVAALIRTASYGSWFNFYLCTLSGTITLPGGSIVHIPVTKNPAPRCQ